MTTESSTQLRTTPCDDVLPSNTTVATSAVCTNSAVGLRQTIVAIGSSSTTRMLSTVIVSAFASSSTRRNDVVNTGNVEDDATVSIERVAVEMVVLAVIWLLAVLGNALVCVVIHRSRRLQSTTNYFVVSLAAADLVLMLVVGPFAAAQELVEAGVGPGPPTFLPPASSCKFVRFVEQLVSASSSFVFVAIAADRFYAIVHPLHFTVTRGRAQRLVVGAWLLAAVAASPCFYFYGPYGVGDGEAGGTGCSRFATEIAVDAASVVDMSAAIAYVSISTAVAFAVPSTVVCLFYFRVGKHIWRVGINGRTFQRTTNPVQRVKVKMVKMLMTLNVVSAILVVPYFAVHLVSCSVSTVTAYGNQIPGSAAYAAALWVLFGSAAAKPIVYVTMNANFRRGCKEVMCMSAMRCYRSHAYTITTTSTLAKKNYVGIIGGGGGGGGTTAGRSAATSPYFGASAMTTIETPRDGLTTPSGLHYDPYLTSFGSSWPGHEPAVAMFATSCSGDGGATSTPETNRQRSDATTVLAGCPESGERTPRSTAFEYSDVVQLSCPLRADQRRVQRSSSMSGSCKSLQGRTARTPYSTYV